MNWKPGISSAVVPADLRSTQLLLLKFDQDLVHLHGVAGVYLDGLDASPGSGDDVGLHLHRFEHKEQVIWLNRLAGLHVHTNDEACDRRTAGVGVAGWSGRLIGRAQTRRGRHRRNVGWARDSVVFSDL